MKAPALLLPLVLMTGATPARAQSLEADGPAFEAATVRPNTSGETRRQIEVLPGGRFNAINMTLWQILSIAYPIDGKFRDEINLTGGPGWINSDRFDIIAKAEGSPQLDTNKPGSTVTEVDRDAVERIRLMLRRFLAERFKLRLHHETRQLPIYDLEMAKKGGGFGPELRKAAGECGRDCGSIRRMGPDRVVGTAVSMGSLAHSMSDWVRRTVVDNTGIAGPMDFTLTWAPDGAPDSGAPSIFTAVEEQLGLKLVPARGPVDVLVVDSAERPTQD
jgi:bla regulator protein blaR1